MDSINFLIASLLGNIPSQLFKEAEAISLILTFLTLQLCAEVFFKWSGEALKFIKGNREPWAWAGFAVTLHFIASFVDNGFWGLAWSYKLVEHSLTDLVMAFGVFPNIPFRQILTCSAAFCYLKAAAIYLKKDSAWLYFRMGVAMFVGSLYVVILRFS